VREPEEEDALGMMGVSTFLDRYSLSVHCWASSTLV